MRIGTHGRGKPLPMQQRFLWFTMRKITAVENQMVGHRVTGDSSVGTVGGSPRPGKAGVKGENWPVRLERGPGSWFPAQQRMIGLIRGNRDSFVLPPAVVRKAAWRE